MLRPHWCLIVSALLGCVGSIGSSNEDEKANTPAPWTPGEKGDPLAVGPAPLRALTHAEFDNTLEELVGDVTHPSLALPNQVFDETGFAKIGRIDDVNVGAYQTTIEGVVSRARKRLLSELGCPIDETCVRAFVARFGRKVYRRPLETSEIDQHLAVFRTLRTAPALPPEDAVLAVVEAMLSSPMFLYHWEAGWKVVPDGIDVVRLNPHAFASRLSYFLWSSMPDEALFAAADSGALSTEAEVEAQARRMLKDPRAKKTMAAFHEQWLGTSTVPSLRRSATLFPRWSQGLGQAMASEVSEFAAHALLEGDGRLETLFTTTETRVNGPLASLYGMEGVTGDAFQAATYPAGQRAGILGLAALNAVYSTAVEGSPIFRGKFITERMLCTHLTPPSFPIPDLEEKNESVPKKERYGQHSKDDVCRGCHKMMDPIGFGLDVYDAIGAYQTMDGRFAVDAKGSFAELDGVPNVTFDGPIELGKKLATSNQVRTCLAQQWFRFALGRNELPADAFALERGFQAFESSDFVVRELLVTLAKSRALTHRALEREETVE